MSTQNARKQVKIRIISNVTYQMSFTLTLEETSEVLNHLFVVTKSKRKKSCIVTMTGKQINAIQDSQVFAQKKATGPEVGISANEKCHDCK